MILDLLTELGVEGLHEKGDEVIGHCPLHEERTGSVDHKPSWSMNTEPPFVHYCFSCGYKGTIIGLFRDLGQEPPEDLRGQMLVVSLSNYRNTAVVADRRRSMAHHPARPPAEEELDPTIIEVPKRLADRRKLVPDTLDRYEIRWSTQTKCWVIPLHDPDGELVGSQVKQSGAVYTLPKGIDKAKLLFGHHRNSPSKFTAVVESPLDVVRLHQCGVQAVAIMGSYVSIAQIDLLAEYFGIIACLDNDPAGYKGNQFLVQRLTRMGKAVFRADYEGYPYKDPGEFPSDTELREFIKASCPFL